MSTPSPQIIIVGGGRVGFHAARLLRGYGHEITLIEEDPARCEEIASDLPTVIQGDATVPPVFEQAAPEDSDIVAALTQDGATNLAVCLMAQRMNERIHTVLRTDTETRREYVELVDSVISPEAAGARFVVNDIVEKEPRALNAVVSGDVEMLQIRVGTDSSAAGKTLAAIPFPGDCLVVTDGLHVAGADTVLEAEQVYTIAVETTVVDEVMEIFNARAV